MYGRQSHIESKTCSANQVIASTASFGEVKSRVIEATGVLKVPGIYVTKETVFENSAPLESGQLWIDPDPSNAERKKGRVFLYDDPGRYGEKEIKPDIIGNTQVQGKLYTDEADAVLVNTDVLSFGRTLYKKNGGARLLHTRTYHEDRTVHKESDFAAHNPGQSYNLGDKVKVGTPAKHYISMVAGNSDTVPGTNVAMWKPVHVYWEDPTRTFANEDYYLAKESNNPSGAVTNSGGGVFIKDTLYRFDLTQNRWIESPFRSAVNFTAPIYTTAISLTFAPTNEVSNDTPYEANGAVTFNVRGNVQSQSVNLTSDDRLKHNETKVDGALVAIDRLKVLKYDKTTRMFPADYKGDLKGISSAKEVGVIAQDLLKISTFKDFVTVPSKVDDTPHYVDYQAINMYHLRATQELHAIVKKQQATIAALSSKVAKLSTSKK